MLNTLRAYRLNGRRKKALETVVDPSFKELLTYSTQNYKKSWRSSEYLAVDIETTGLDPKVDQMVSIGWVPISSARVQLNEAEQLLVTTDASINKSAIIHGLRKQDISDGMPVEQALKQLVVALQGRVLLVHFSGLDKVLLDRLCVKTYGSKLEVPMVDTLEVARKQLRHQDLHASDFALLSLCTRFNLPRHSQHEALTDALATAQLFLALMTRARNRTETPLLDVVS